MFWMTLDTFGSMSHVDDCVNMGGKKKKGGREQGLYIGARAGNFSLSLSLSKGMAVSTYLVAQLF